MTDKIKFAKHIQNSTIHNPMMDNQLDTQALEIRKDPLTGAQSVFNPRLEGKVRAKQDLERQCFMSRAMPS